MAATLTARVTNMNGQIVAGKRGGQHRVLNSDPLGNVVDVRDSAGTQLASYNFWPYGEVRTSTGSISNPWMFCGVWGYYNDGSTYYVRARTYRPDLARWLTVDPLWPNEPAFDYVNANPCRYYDPLGTQTIIFGEPELVPERILPPGWEVVKGGKGGKTGPLPPFWLDPVREWGNECERVTKANKDNYQKPCDELHEWYKKYCFGRGTGLPDPPRCKKGMPPKQLAQLKKLHCSCWKGRQMWNHYCLFLMPHKKHIGQTVAEKSAKNRCEECRALLLGGRDHDPVPPFFDDVDWIPEPPFPGA